MRLVLFLIFFPVAMAEPRARELGVPFHGSPGAANAITDVAGVSVGHTTLIEGTNVRTGVTAIWPRGSTRTAPAFGGWFSLNGNGEMTGTAWVEESGLVDGPILLTNTHSVGVVRDAFIQWQVKNQRSPGTNVVAPGVFWSMPIVAETYDGFLNETNGFHVKPEHVWRALESASGGTVEEGAIGGGTGMICYGFKGGIGTSSRKAGLYTVGAMVQCNCGRRDQLRIGGAPIGEMIGPRTASADQPGIKQERGSIIIVVATDAPLLPHQLKRLARRATLGLARTGSTSSNYSGDLFIAFSTANEGRAGAKGTAELRALGNDDLDPIFTAVVDSVEEAIVNAMVAAKPMEGFEGHKVESLPHDRVREVMKRYNRSE